MKQNIRKLDDLFDYAHKTFGFSKKQIISQHRKREIVLVRQSLMYFSLTHRLDNMLSLKSVGHTFGGRDHSTVVHARDKVKNALKSPRVDAELYNVAKTIKDGCNFNPPYNAVPKVELSIYGISGMIRQYNSIDGSHIERLWAMKKMNGL